MSGSLDLLSQKGLCSCNSGDAKQAAGRIELWQEVWASDRNLWRVCNTD